MSSNTENYIRECLGKLDPPVEPVLLAAYGYSSKVPKHVEFLDELPKTAVGKILRRELRCD